MNFLPYANLLEQIFVVLSGLVYLLPLQKREPIELRLLSGLIMGGTLMVGPAMVLPQNGSTNFLLVVLDLVVMSFVVYYCATIKKSAAFYVAIWSLVTSQFFMNLWHVLYQLSPFRNNGSLARAWILCRGAGDCWADNGEVYAGKGKVPYWTAPDDIRSFVLSSF